MFFDPIEIPDKLLEAQEKGNLVVFAGAGVSMGEPSNLPSFKSLAAHIAEGHPFAAEIKKYNSRLDSFLGELSRRKVDVQRRCRVKIDDSTSKPTDLHRSLATLFVKPEHVRIVTTNFDNHFRSVMEERKLTPDYYHAPALPLGHQFSGVVYLHGCLSRTEPLVLTDEDFGRAYLTEGWAREFLQRLFAGFTTLFVGYSHNDIPVEYLARGISGKSLAPRFALTNGGGAGQWGSLGITDITYKKTRGKNPFQNLYNGVMKWAEFTKQQPIEIAERVKTIVSAPDKFAPDKSQSGLLNRRLAREDSCHFFTHEAKGWRWVTWLRKQGLLRPLFESSPRELTKPQGDLACWLATALLEEPSDEGLLLVEKHRGYLARPLWSSLCRRLWVNGETNWSSQLTQKWVLILLDNCHRDSMEELSFLLPKVANAAPNTVGMALLRCLTSFRVVLREGLDYDSLAKGGAKVESKSKAEIDIVIVGAVHDLLQAWEESFKPRLSELGEPLVLLLENRLREAHELYRAAERGNPIYDPCCHRGQISERDVYRTGDVNLILDFFLDVIEQSAERECSLTEQRVLGWLDSEVPVLVRLGLYALHLSKHIPHLGKVTLLQDRRLVYPPVFGARHEAWLVLTDCYSVLDALSKQLLWQAIDHGPSMDRPDAIAPQAWEELRQGQIDKLTWFLAAKNRGCPQADQALDALNKRRLGFQGHEGMDQDFFGGVKVLEGPRTPRSATELLGSLPNSQIEWLLSFSGGKGPFEQSREGLRASVREACAQDQAWGVALLEELASREAWKSDLWEAATVSIFLDKYRPV